MAIVHSTVPDTKSTSREVWYVVAAMAVLSVVATAYYFAQNAILLYPDAVARLEIARRFLDSATPGFGQLGGVWLPLPQLLMQPFIYVDGLYYSGLAGSFVSMASYVVAGVYLFKTVRGLGGGRAAAIAGLAIFAFNPNVLYLQATPMSEMLLFAAMAAMVYYTQRWIQTWHYRPLLAAGCASLVGSLTRYEAWILTAVLMVVIGSVAWKRYGYRRAEGVVLGFAFLGVIGIVGWVLWNWIIFSNPLNWQNGEYAKSSLWVGSTEPSVGEFQVSVETYWYAVNANLGVIITGLMFVGIMALVVLRRRLEVLPVLSLLALWPFFVIALYEGQRPLHVMQISNDLYNVRFGLLMVLPASIAIGYLVSLSSRVHKRLRVALASLVLVAAAFMASVTPTPVLRLEPQVWAIASRYNASTDAASFLRQQYDHGKVLGTFFGNEDLFFRAKVPLRENIYEGNYKLWDVSLANPKGHQIRWIVLRPGDATDAAATKLNSAALSDYQKVYDKGGYRIYKEKA